MEEDGKRFKNTYLSECLRADSMQSAALFFLSDWHKQACANLFQSVKTGKIAFESAHGKAAFDWLKSNPDEATEYIKQQGFKNK